MNIPCDLQIPDAASMRALGEHLAAQAVAGDLFVLTGSLGAGKTTLVQGMAQALGIPERITSPTFVLMRSYRTDRGIELVHVDAYRVHTGVEIDDLDIDVATCITAVEWGAEAAPRLADRWLAIHITADEGIENLRHVSIREVVNPDLVGQLPLSDEQG